MLCFGVNKYLYKVLIEFNQLYIIFNVSFLLRTFENFIELIKSNTCGIHPRHITHNYSIFEYAVHPTLFDTFGSYLFVNSVPKSLFYLCLQSNLECFE